MPPNFRELSFYTEYVEFRMKLEIRSEHQIRTRSTKWLSLCFTQFLVFSVVTYLADGKNRPESNIGIWSKIEMCPLQFYFGRSLASNFLSEGRYRENSLWSFDREWYKTPGCVTICSLYSIPFYSSRLLTSTTWPRRPTRKRRSRISSSMNLSL